MLLLQLLSPCLLLIQAIVGASLRKAIIGRQWDVAGGLLADPNARFSLDTFLKALRTGPTEVAQAFMNHPSLFPEMTNFALSSYIIRDNAAMLRMLLACPLADPRIYGSSDIIKELERAKPRGVMALLEDARVDPNIFASVAQRLGIERLLYSVAIFDELGSVPEEQLATLRPEEQAVIQVRNASRATISAKEQARFARQLHLIGRIPQENSPYAEAFRFLLEIIGTHHLPLGTNDLIGKIKAMRALHIALGRNPSIMPEMVAMIGAYCPI